MRSLALFLPSPVERRIASDSERHGNRVIVRARTRQDIESTVRKNSVDSAVIGAGRDYLDQQLLDACDVAGVRVVALAATDTDRRHAADLGLREILDEGVDWDQIERVLNLESFHASASNSFVAEATASPGPASGAPTQGRRESALRATQVTPTEPHRGEVITVWGPAGAPGRTTVAITVAAELAAEGYSVALVDADTHSGAIAPSLGLLDEAPGFAAACRLASTNSLTTAELERVSERYSSPHGSFWVLTGIGRPHRWPELSCDRVAATLRACRDWVDYTVVDTGFSLESDEEISSDLRAPQRNAATITALREADRVIAVGAGDPVGLSRFLRAHVDLLDLVDAERVLAVVNRIRGSVIGSHPSAQVEQTLLRFGGIVASALVPHDQNSLDSAILSGKTLADVAAKSAPRLALRSLVTSRIMPQRSVHVKSRSLRNRLEWTHGGADGR